MSSHTPTTEPTRRPEWLRVKVKDSATYKEVERLVGGLRLHTVCEEARCPNIWECWGEHRTATFMLLGDVCTRNCRYCSVTHGRPGPLDPAEPQNVAAAVERLGLAHAVITSVDRDDLGDFGAGQFVAAIRAIRQRTPKCRVELLIPDFAGDEPALRQVLEARPDVLGHNMETVPRLFDRMRPKGDYARSLELLARADAYRRRDAGADEKPSPLEGEGRVGGLVTKSGLMVGLGESIEDIVGVMDDLRAVGCDVLTLGQYLNPTRKHLAVARFYSPEEFSQLKQEGLARGFRYVESGPLVRSSYHAHSHVPRV